MVTTRAFTWRGGSLTVNLAAGKSPAFDNENEGGHILVGVLNATTRRGSDGIDCVEGLDAAAAVPLAEDSLAAVARWRTAAAAGAGGAGAATTADLSQLAGHAVALRFHICGAARLFAFSTTTASPPKGMNLDTRGMSGDVVEMRSSDQRRKEKLAELLLLLRGMKNELTEF